MKNGGFGIMGVLILIILGFLVYGTYLYAQNVRSQASASPTPVNKYTK